MEKITTSSIEISIRKVFKGLMSDESHPDIAWRVMLWVFIVALCAFSVVSMSVYRWAVIPAEISPAKPERSVTISREEISRVVQIYAQKSSEYEALKSGKAIDMPNIIKSESLPKTNSATGTVESVN